MACTNGKVWAVCRNVNERQKRWTLLESLGIMSVHDSTVCKCWNMNQLQTKILSRGRICCLHWANTTQAIIKCTQLDSGDNSQREQKHFVSMVKNKQAADKTLSSHKSQNDITKKHIRAGSIFSGQMHSALFSEVEWHFICAASSIKKLIETKSCCQRSLKQVDYP